MHNSKLVEQVVIANKLARDLREALEAKWHMILKYREEAITDYKSNVGFRRCLKRSGVISYQFGYQIALTHFKLRYPKLELKKDSFTNYPDD
ncbi:hypothetical protein B296_00050801 [Ensete ventricosum]|uniref:Uncharacterized protein n=1 Tax=Ensete ventricosum TaxID=4639 RepID=A0A426WZ12_ENSVE|nr:hypothetical protein B296_00050801 [Ensete ventricosum]